MGQAPGFLKKERLEEASKKKETAKEGPRPCKKTAEKKVPKELRGIRLRGKKVG